MLPLIARTTKARRPYRPVVYGCVQLVAVREGSAILSGEFGQRPINIGDVLLIGANVACGAEPEGQVTVTTVYLDPDYAVDQFYWQHTGLLLDRLEAHDMAALVFSESVQLLRLGERRLGELVPWLDELAELSRAGHPSESFTRMQVLWFLLVDAICPYMKTVPVPEVVAQSAKARPRWLGNRRLADPVRVEALTVRDALHGNIARRWYVARSCGDGASVSEATRPRVRRGLWQDALCVSCEAAGGGDGATAARREPHRGCCRAPGRMGANPSLEHIRPARRRHAGPVPPLWSPSAAVGNGAHLPTEARPSRPENRQRS